MQSERNQFFQRISVRLALWYGITLLLLLSAFALFTFLVFRQGQVRDFDQHLYHERMQLLPLVSVENGEPGFAASIAARSVAYQTEGAFGTFVRLLTPEGGVLYASPNIERSDLQVRLPEEDAEASVRHRWQDRQARTLYTPLRSAQGNLVGWLEVTGFEWVLEQELVGLARAMMIGILLSVIVAVFAGYLLGRRALEPVSEMTEAADRIGATDLGARLPTRFGVRDELSELAETFNRLIDRIESSFQRERRFTDNAAHELLTPLTTISNSIEIALRRQREPDAYRATLEAIQTDVDEMAETVQGLLLLARMDLREELPRSRVDLSRVVLEQVARFEDRASAREVELETEVDPSIHVRADAGRCADILGNLVDNALKYTPPAGKVVVTLAREGNGALLAVRDTGIGFSHTERDRLFDRFFRSDRAEVQRLPGSGLGLSIVSALAEAFGGSVRAHSEGPGKGSRFEVWLPAD